MWILVPFLRPKVVILGLVFIAYVPCTNFVKNVNFGSIGTMLCGFWYRSHDPKLSDLVLFSSPMFHAHYVVKIVNFGSTGTMLCLFLYRSHDQKLSDLILFKSPMFHPRML